MILVIGNSKRKKKDSNKPSAREDRKSKAMIVKTTALATQKQGKCSLQKK
jgi:hypothetical protein